MSQKTASVCLVTPSLKLGGLENSVSVMANYFAHKGYKVTIVTIYKFRHFYLLHKSIDVVEPEYTKRNTPKFWYYVKTVFFLRSTIRKIHSGTILSYGDYINALVLLANFGLGFPCYVSDRSSPGKRFPFLVAAMRRLLYRRATGIIAQTNSALQQKKAMLGQNINIRVIPNPIRPIKQYSDIPKENIVLAVARHYHVKGLDQLIRAFSMTNRADWRLEIAGSEGPETPYLKKLSKKLGVQSQIIFLGAVKDMDSVYARSSIFVLPSRSEGFPNVLIEAMAHGIPCISFDIDAGPADIIEHDKNGLLVEAGNIDLLADQISRLIKREPDRTRLGEEAKEIKDKLELSAIGKQIEHFIFEMTNND